MGVARDVRLHGQVAYEGDKTVEISLHSRIGLRLTAGTVRRRRSLSQRARQRRAPGSVHRAGIARIRQKLVLNGVSGFAGQPFPSRQRGRRAEIAVVAVDRAQNISEAVTTPTVANDMFSIMKAFGANKLNYWGIS